MGTIADLNELTTPDALDYWVVRDVSDVLDKDKKVLLGKFPLKYQTPVALRAVRWRDANTVEDAGFAVSDIARLSLGQSYTAANTFTGGQTNAPAATNTFGLIVNMPAGTTVTAFRGQYDSANAFDFWATAANRGLDIYAYDNGAAAGPYITVRNNNNATTPASGTIRLFNRGGTQYYIWPDASANLRIGSTAVTSATDGGGTIVGSQTSQLAAKNILGEGVAPSRALQTILETKVVEFDYKSGAYNRTRFHGIVAEWSPQFSMDEGRSFNPVSATGYLIQGMKELVRRLAIAEAELTELRGS